MIRRRDRDEKLDLPNLLYGMAGRVLLVHKVKVAKLVEGALIPRRWARYLDLSHESNTGGHVRSRVVVCTRLNYSKQYPPRNLVVTLFDLLRSGSVDINGQIHNLLLFRNSWNGWETVSRRESWFLSEIILLLYTS